MLIQKQDESYQCGPLDVVCILHDVTTDRYHAAFFEEKPFPGPVEPVEKTDVVRLKSKMHNTTGADTLGGALTHLMDLAKRLSVPEGNIWKDPCDWDGELGIVWVIPNWLRSAAEQGEA